MTKQLAAALFAYLVSLSPTCFASDGELPGTQSLKNIDALDRSTSIDLVSKAGSSAEQKLKAIKAKYPRYRMVGGCIGSFKTDGAYDIGVAMVDPHEDRGIRRRPGGFEKKLDIGNYEVSDRIRPRRGAS